jgi:drug/metabolite transporter (DMT)-like permease
MSEALATPPFPLAGELASLGAAMIWSLTMSIFTRHGAKVPAASLNLYKNFVAITCLAAAVLVVRPEVPTDPTQFLWLAGSGIVGLSLGDTALFAALKRLGAQLTSAMQCLAPPIAAGLAAGFLGESLSGPELAGMLVTTAAIGAIMYFGRRGGAHLSALTPKQAALGLVFALIAATCQGLGVVMSRHALQSVHVVYGTLMRVSPALFVLFGMMLASGQRGSFRDVFMTRKQGLLLTLASFGGTFCGLLLMSMGAKYAKAGIAAALTSTYPVWIIPIARFVLKERVSWQSAVFTIVAVLGIVLMMVRP